MNEPTPAPLPCPWCGGETRATYTPNIDTPGPTAWVQCLTRNCAQGPMRYGESAAVAAWNEVAVRPAWPWLDADGKPVSVQDHVTSKQGDEVVVVSLGAGGLLELASALSPAFVERSHFCRLIRAAS